MNRRPDRRRNGFTLIEVLVAFVILGVASLALYRGITTGLSGTELSEARIAALLLARSRLDEIGASIPVEPGTQSGVFNGGFRWTVRIAPFLEAGDPTAAGPADDAPSPMAVYQIAVTVADRSGFPVTLTSWRLAPRS